MPKFNKEEIEKYYEIIGVNNFKDLIRCDSINLAYISDLYELNDLEHKVSYTTKELSDVYSLLIQMIRDGFLYTTKKRKESALNASFEVINDLTKFNIEDSDEENTIERRNNLRSTIIKGLTEVDDIVNFRLYQQNASFNLVYSKLSELESDDPIDYKKLYYLVAYSKFKDNSLDKQMFDSLNKVSLLNLKKMLQINIYEQVPFKDEEQEVNKKIIRLDTRKR